MTIDEMIKLFDLIQDKVESSYFNDQDKLKFINAAQMRFVSDISISYLQGGGKIYPGSSIASTIEDTHTGLELLRPLIVPDLEIASDADGQILYTSLEGLINAETGNNEKLYKILNVSNDGKDVRFIRHNDFYKIARNDFKKPEANYKVFRINIKGIKINPAGVDDYNVTVLKYPNNMVYFSDGDPLNVDCELPEVTHNEILAISLSLAGVSTREQAILSVDQLRNNA